MPLPTSPDVILAPGDPIPAQLLNALQQYVVASYEPRRVMNPGPVVDEPGPTATWTYSYDGVLSASNDGEACRRDLGPLPVGRTLQSIEVQADVPGAGVSQLSITLQVADEDGSVSNASTMSTVSSGLQTITLTPTAGNEVVQDNCRYFLRFATTDSTIALGSDFQIYNITLVFA
ncbi:hypothetical protein [Haliangium sp.]|uniref:hypothetical protein n=1 Tax=Haliangium sp. TaxID=2663208 RepID=UPI003D0EEEC2